MKAKKWTVLLTGRPVRSGEVGVILTRWEIGFIRQLILDHGPERGPKARATADLFGKTTVATLFFQKKDTMHSRRQKARHRLATEIESLEKMLDGSGEQDGPS